HVRGANSRRNDEANFAALEFFVEAERLENLFPWKIFRQLRRQIESPQKIDNRITLIARQTGSFHRDVAGCDNSKTNRFAVKKFPVITSTLNRVTNSVTEIEKRAFAGAITLVFRHDFRLYLDVAVDKRREVFGIDISKRHKHFRIGDDGMLDDLREALVEIASWQCLKNIDIVNHERRMMEGAEQIFPVARIHPGLPAD